jgi:hypothetical protein
MCPVCVTTAVLIAGSVTSSSGLAAIAVKTFGCRNTVKNNPAQLDPSCFDKRTE